MKRLHVSNSISKLGVNIPSVNLPAIITCRPDAPCFKTCYANKGRFAFPHNRDLLMNNLLLWQEDPECFEREATAAFALSRFVRWHSSGDIPDAEYFEMMVRIANVLPDVKFLAFTKQFEIVNAYLDAHNGELPGNFSVVFSAWGDDFQPVNPYNLPVAYVRLKKTPCTIPEDAMECSGYCGECAATGCSCWHLKRGESTVFNQH